MDAPANSSSNAGNLPDDPRNIHRRSVIPTDAEEKLRASEARLKMAQASAGAGMWDWDIPAGTLEWSDELFGLFGLDPRGTLPSFEAWRSVLQPEDRALAQERIEAAVNNHAALASEYRIVMPSGEVRWINALGNTVYDSEGKPLRMSGICIDITSRKWAEEALRHSEELFRSPFDHMSEGFFLAEVICDTTGHPVRLPVSRRHSWGAPVRGPRHLAPQHDRQFSGQFAAPGLRAAPAHRWCEAAVPAHPPDLQRPRK